LTRGHGVGVFDPYPRLRNQKEDQMFGIGMPELIIILIIILVIFGAGKLPQIGAGLGQGIMDFKKATSGKSEDNPELKETRKLEREEA
jgi:sec-independent protein translocase protein TatA